MLSVAKYQLRSFRQSVLIYYAVSIGLIIFLTVISGGNVEYSGLGFSSFIFIFVLGLNSFRNEFHFLQANGVSRKKFFMGSALALATLAATMTLIDMLIGLGLGQFMLYRSLMTVYSLNLAGPAAQLVEFVWTTAFYTAVAYIGWFITMVYYRVNTVQKVLVSVSPVLLIILLVFFESATSRNIFIPIGIFILTALGFSPDALPNPYIAIFTFLVVAGIVSTFNFLLIRRIRIKL